MVYLKQSTNFAPTILSIFLLLIKKSIMKTKDLIEKLYDEFDAKNESMVLIYTDKDGQTTSYSCGKFDEISSTIASMIDSVLSDDSVDKSGKFITNAIVDGIRAVLAIPSKAGKKLAVKFTMDLLRASILEKANIHSPKEFSDLIDSLDGDDDDEDEENCATCNANRICPLPQAIEYRKENHIHAPVRKHRKPKKHDEQCS